MDEDFGPAALAIVGGDVAELTASLEDDPELATRRSSCGHPTLLQLVACEAENLPNPVDMARVLVDAGAEMGGPLVAAAGCNAMGVVELLLDRGALIDGDDLWTPLDEAIYWNNGEIAAYLVERGARVRALSTAAGLGSVERVEAFFDGDRLNAGAGPIASPFPDTVPPELANDPQAILDHAFVMAVNAGHQQVAERLLRRGARIDSKPPGYHWHGTALHAAAWRGQRDLMAWLLAEGADPAVRDGMVDADAAGWIRHHGHDHLLELLDLPD